MKIQRDIIEWLKQWKDSESRKPVLLRGARQIGKTWVMEEFGRQCFEHVAEFNFDKVKELNDVFEKTKDIDRILKEGSGRGKIGYAYQWQKSFDLCR